MNDQFPPQGPQFMNQGENMDEWETIKTQQMLFDCFARRQDSDEQREINELVRFMSGPDAWTLGRLISFFSMPTPGVSERGLYCPPKELKSFWESLSDSQKDEYRLFVLGLKF